jgi:homoserine O-succinyltransferase
MSVLGSPLTLTAQARPKQQRPRIVVGVINNMGDRALKTTERQLGNLLAQAAHDVEVQIRVFALSRTRRSPRAVDYIRAHYEPASAVADSELHALIVTGAQPQTDRLTEETYWEELVELIEWAKVHTVSTILSCLAAHAGVLHLDGIERRPLAEKCTGVFAFATQRPHPLVGKQGGTRLVPHSRYNGLPKDELEQADYAVLTCSPAHGVDTFAKSFGSLFVFLQGHPEYDSDSLAREYRRDMDLYLRRETDRKPTRPSGYFCEKAEIELCEMERRAQENRSYMRTRDLSMIDSLAPSEAIWRATAVSFYRNWIKMIESLIHRSCARPLGLEAPNLATQHYAL